MTVSCSGSVKQARRLAFEPPLVCIADRIILPPPIWLFVENPFALRFDEACGKRSKFLRRRKGGRVV